MEKLQKIILILIGYIIFALIIVGIEAIVAIQLKANITAMYIKMNIVYTLLIYSILNTIFWGINYISNYKTVKKLNNALKNIQKKGEKNEK
ncbi:MAG: hypothetical protein J6K45_03090 [Clostridia bacterium]|nr:hypothetical protein [Clostridia bacterium]